MGGDLKTAWRPSFNDGKRVRGVYTRDAFFLTFTHFVSWEFARGYTYQVYIFLKVFNIWHKLFVTLNFSVK